MITAQSWYKCLGVSVYVRHALIFLHIFFEKR
nr:MAG TPA: hypothetical protein [Bacteriophage sp.]